MSYPSAPTRSLPDKPSLAQLRKQAKELLNSYRAGNDAAVAEVERFERNSLDRAFALTDAKRKIATRGSATRGNPPARRSMRCGRPSPRAAPWRPSP